MKFYQGMTMQADVIVAWPKSVDYPLFRRFLRENIHYFSKVIIVFTETNHGYDYRQFVRESLGDIHNVIFLDNPSIVDEDWRDVAVNYALEYVDSDIVWFIEQDLIINDPKFIPWCLIQIGYYDVIGYMDGSTRMHPCNLWVTSEAIAKTNRDFGIVPGKLDHFASFFQDLKRIPNVKMLKLTYPSNSFYHMNGLSHNMTLLENGEPITYQPKEFQGYLAMCLQEKKLHPEFKKLAEQGIEELTE